MDLNSLLRRHQLSLMVADAALAPDEKRAHDQFARDYAEQIRRTRHSLGARPALPGSVT
jgi:hypothetical protein